MQAEIFVPFIFFAFLASVIVGPLWIRESTKRSAYALVSRALERGQTLDPALITQLSETMIQEGDRARKSLGAAVILLALAGAFVGIAYVNGDMQHGGWHDGLLVPAILFGALGVAFVLLALIDYASKRRNAG